MEEIKLLKGFITQTEAEDRGLVYAGVSASQSLKNQKAIIKEAKRLEEKINIKHYPVVQNNGEGLYVYADYAIIYYNELNRIKNGLRNQVRYASSRITEFLGDIESLCGRE